MTYRFAIDVLGLGGIVPALISFATVLAWRWLLPNRVSERCSLAAAFGISFVAGYVLLPSWAELIPTRHWHWLPYLGAAAVILSPFSLAAGPASARSWMPRLLLAIAAAWLLVPTWSSLEPPRSVYIPILAGYLFLLMTLMEPLATRLPGRTFLALLFLVAAFSAVAVAALVSESYGRVAGLAAAAVAGNFAASCFRSDTMSIRGLIPAYTIVVGGAVFVGCIEPEPAMLPLLMIPAAPLSLWSCVRGPLACPKRTTATVIQFTTVLVPLAVAVAVVVLSRVTLD